MNPVSPLFLKIAGFTFKINFVESEYPFYKEKYYKDGLTIYLRGLLLLESATKIDYEIDLIFKNTFEVLITKPQKNFINLFTQVTENKIETYYHLSYEQFSFVIRHGLQKLLAKNSGLILHGSASVYHEKAYIFLGDSGAGKSTIVRMLSKSFLPVADDFLIIKEENQHLMLYQMPMIEKNLSIEKKSQGYKIDKFLFLKQDQQHQLVEINSREQIQELFNRQIYTEKNDLANQTKVLLRTINKFPNFFQLSFALTDTQNLVNLLK